MPQIQDSRFKLPTRYRMTYLIYSVTGYVTHGHSVGKLISDISDTWMLDAWVYVYFELFER